MNPVEQFNHVFYPRSVAVVGASSNPSKQGYLCLSNLLEGGYQGRVYPINPTMGEAFGLKVYPSVRAVPDEVDLAVIVIPAEASVAAVEDCAAKGVKGAILVTSGFKEVGTESGAELQDAIRDIARKAGMRIIGPNTIGLVNPEVRLNATFHPGLSVGFPGRVAIATQSGGMCSYLLQTLTSHNVGISKATGLGNRCELDFEDVVAYFGADEATRVIAIYMEGLDEPRRLMRVAREVVQRKPIIALKGARSRELDGATLSHTGALAGNYELYKAAFVQCGIIGVDEITEMVDKAKTLALQAPAAGNRIALLSATAGLSIVMADRCQRYGLKLARFSPSSLRRLRGLVSELNSVDNPVDMSWAVHDAGVSRGVLDTVMGDSGVDAVVAAVGGASEALGFTQASCEAVKKYGKPMTVCLGPFSKSMDMLMKMFEESGIPTYPLPDRAITGMSALVHYGEIRGRFLG